VSGFLEEGDGQISLLYKLFKFLVKQNIDVKQFYLYDQSWLMFLVNL